MQFVKTYDYSPELLDSILSGVNKASDTFLITQILGLFHDAGLHIKVKQCFPDSPNEYYRLSCFIKKSAETVIINTKQDLGKDGVIDGLNIQIRILNQDTLNNLDLLSENIRNQIIRANDCRYCSDKCVGKKYVFSYNDTEYTKCQYLCSNFRLTVENDNDINNIISIIKAEISYKNTKKKVQKQRI